MIEIDRLTKRYTLNGKNALDNLSYVSDTAAPLGIIGSNGAGKSTLFMLANGLTKPTSGKIKLFGEEVFGNSNVKKRTGLFTDKLTLYPMLTVKETISFFMGIYGISFKEYKEKVRLFHIDEFENSKIEDLSTGMMKKVMLLISILHTPSILFLDEPFSGLDVDAKNDLSKEIRYLSNEVGIKTVISSHDLWETQGIIQDVLIIEGGRNIESGNYQELIKKYSKTKKMQVICKNDPEILRLREDYRMEEEYGNIKISIGLDELHGFLSRVRRENVINIINNDMTLEDIYEEARKHAAIGND
ncbi:MAG: ABC transporter ATP-binding protein [Lachnospiraceae bacterium]|nr:ABC transporter ATP-binding protein [Lachnospiraceae bacterium]